ncbi:hypothetical protein VTK26DRAFT_5345 [Humicola hyalothermophila]
MRRTPSHTLPPLQHAPEFRDTRRNGAEGTEGYTPPSHVLLASLPTIQDWAMSRLSRLLAQPFFPQSFPTWWLAWHRFYSQSYRRFDLTDALAYIRVHLTFLLPFRLKSSSGSQSNVSLFRSESEVRRLRGRSETPGFHKKMGSMRGSQENRLYMHRRYACKGDERPGDTDGVDTVARGMSTLSFMSAVGSP